MPPRRRPSSRPCSRKVKLLELLAPARTTDIGFAAIDCGADAVYIAGPAFGARQAAGNSVEDIARLCAYAQRFGVRVFVTLNTILYEDELPEAGRLVQALAGAGVSALIVQDPAVIALAQGTGMALHASTQCAVRTVQDARFAESLGYGRIVPERQLSLAQIRAIRDAVDAELECFVHGALCVCYSGQCYLSEYLTGRSANRGACAQACRSRYDLEDAGGRVLLRNKALLSLKDLQLIERLEDLAEAGVQSFKIEGRLKGETYVRNVVKAYSEALDALVAARPEQYRRASFGKVRGGFAPALDKTFNRGYTTLFLDGTRGEWSSKDAPKSMGEYVGTVRRMTPDGLLLAPARPDLALCNGDGFAFVGKDGDIRGFRADVCEGFRIRCQCPPGLREGSPLYRNISAAFEKAVAAGKTIREIDVRIDVTVEREQLCARALTEDGRRTRLVFPVAGDCARNPQTLLEGIRRQIGKRSAPYAFRPGDVTLADGAPFLSVAFLNAVRRALAEALDQLPVNAAPLRQGRECPEVKAPESLSYKANVANPASRALYAARGAREIESAYELSHRSGAELMRSKYCIRHELGLCPRQQGGGRAAPLYLRNGGRRLRLDFHCTACEMSVTAQR